MPSWLQACKLPQQPLTAFLERDFFRRGAREAPPAPAAKKAKEDQSYKVDHLQAYNLASLSWPPTYGEDFSKLTAGMSDRMREVVYYYTNRPMQPPLPPEVETCHDVNMSIHFDSCTLGMAPCIVSTSRIWLRKAQCELSGKELLRLQGWPLEVSLKAGDPPYTESQLCDLAGNAFCGYVVSGVLITLFAMLDAPTAQQKRRDIFAAGAPSRSSSASESAREGSEDSDRSSEG